MTHLINRPRFVFVHIPKNAGTFIVSHICDHFGFPFRDKSPGLRLPGSNKQHFTLSQIEKEIDISSAFVFSSVRDPRDRAISQILWILRIAAQRGEKVPFTDAAPSDKEAWERNIKALCEAEKPIYLHDITLTQSDYLRSDKRVDHIINVESIESQWDPVERAIGVPVPSGESKNISNGRSRWQDYYTDRSLSMVESKFDEDFKFGYEKSQKPTK